MLSRETARTPLRSVVVFDGAGTSGSPAVLAVWAAAGFALLAVGGLRGRARQAAGRDREPVPA